MRWIIVALVVLAQAAAAQPSVENATFYGKVDCDAQVYGLSVVAESPATNCGTGTPAASFKWTMSEDPPIESELLLEEGGDVAMSVWVGSNTHGGRVDITSTIFAGSTVVATATSTAQFAGAAGTTYVHVAMTAPAQVDRIVEPLRWEVEAEGVFTSIFMRFEEGRWTQFTLPIVGVVGGPGDSDEGPQPVFEQLDAAPDLNLSFDGADATYVYNWTQAGPLGSMAYDVNGTGNVTATLVDGSGSVVAAQRLNGTGSVALDESVPGNWSLTLTAQDHNGTLRLFFEPPGTSTQTGTGTSTGTGTQTDDETGTKDKDSPLPIVLALAALVLAARRR